MNPKYRIQINAVITQGEAAKFADVDITIQRGRRAKVTETYQALIQDDIIQVANEFDTTLDRIILVRKVIRAAIDE